ncbi:hydroperoxy fatty acid reductase gpx2 [mine drainage metagenome]|uniref:Hydroperoxy fatty acid reductase gpx2 n=1 Tax=mine drainage metagenome TaxID=410659 RepID=A0A1J5PKR1_9ZZZZ
MTTAYDFAFKTIDGADLPLTTFKDKVVLVVNTASKCGLTPQYDGLEKLYSDYKDRGLVVLGVPCNQFMGQEPGTEAEIKDFCETRFNIDFPLTSKEDVKGETAHPFYKWALETLGESADPAWNFHKLLFGKDGQLIRAFGPRTEPLDGEITGAVEAAL